MADVTLGQAGAVHRPRNVDWKRAAALLYGDWGTSKAYVLGLAFAAASFSSFPIILAVCILTAVVGYNYIIVCAHFPDGGGVYSAAREQSRFLASVGALLLVANFIVTAALSGWSAVSYLGVSDTNARIATIGLVLVVGVINFFGPKHSGSVSIWLAIPAVSVVLIILGLSSPHLNTAHLEPRHANLGVVWVQFVGVILALSGVEAVANITGVMKLDPDSTPDKPKVTRTAAKAIIPVAIEVVGATALLGWAMLSVPKTFGPELASHKEDMLRFLGEHYGSITVAPAFGEMLGILVGVVFGLLLFSAVNTAVVALIGVDLHDGAGWRDATTARASESSRRSVYSTRRGNRYPDRRAGRDKGFRSSGRVICHRCCRSDHGQSRLCTFNKRLALPWYQRLIMGATFVVLFAVELTIAKTKPDALFFAICVLGIGLALRAYSHKLSGLKTLTLTRKVAEMVTPDLHTSMEPRLEEGQKIMVATRGINPVLNFALEEAQLRKAVLCVLYVKEVVVYFSAAPHRARPRKVAG